jgi:Domain of unknown function (DUF1844)
MSESLPEPSLPVLIHLLAEQSLLALGIPHPQLQHQPPANPKVARFYIDLLDLLRQKTEGHRSEADTKELDDVLYGLRMRLMNLAPAAPGAESRV